MTARIQPECPICRQPGDGLWCPRCAGTWQADLDWIAAVGWPELAVTETKRARMSETRARVSTMPALPYSPAAAEARAQTRAVLTGWADVLGAPLALVTASIITLTGWLHTHLDQARRHEANTDIWAETHAVKNQILHAIDRPTDREYLGECPSSECTKKHLPLTCKARAATVECWNCHQIFDAIKIREQRRQWSDDQLVTRDQLVKAYPPRTVDRWIQSGAIQNHGTVGGRPAFNLGDIRALREMNAKHGHRHARKTRGA